MRIALIVFLLPLLMSCVGQEDSPDGETFTLTILGTNDLHGELLPSEFSGGLTTFSGYVAAVRAARAEDGGAVLLIDAGDMWQGTLESNLEEGAPVVEAYNALDYAAATIGNHEFDFGPVGELAIPSGPDDDPRGALRQRISEAKFPILNANIVDQTTGELVDWDNVTPSVLVEAGGVQVGIIGLLTLHGLNATIAANVVGLEVAPLAEAIIREASALRAQGADIIVVTAHAGGECSEHHDPLDLSTCKPGGEIVQVANALPVGLVDHIIAGHVHKAMAHVINGIAVTSGYSNSYAFDRVDFTVDRLSGRVIDRRIYPPQINCPAWFKSNSECAWTETDADLITPASYEGRPVRVMTSVLEITKRTEAHTAAIKSEPLGVALDTTFDLVGNPESLLGNLFTSAMLESTDADIAIHNVSGGIRAILPAGEVTFGRVYEMFPFDNRAAIIVLSGAELRQIFSAQIKRQHRRAGFAGMQVSADCDDGEPDIKMVLSDGRVIADDDRLRVITNDFLVLGGDEILAPVMPADNFEVANNMPLARDLLIEWFRQRGGRISAADFDSSGARRWKLSASCSL